LVEANGMLYGTTGFAGSGGYCNVGNSCGTVFSLDPATGTETTLYSFCSQQNCADGAAPNGDLTYLKGALYGTTASNNVFSIDPTTGAENVVYAFCSAKRCRDGSQPFAGLIEVNGTLYGTTAYGGHRCCGTAFSLDPATSTETVLYAFCQHTKSCSDGSTPRAGLIDVNGIFYGTTMQGGRTSKCGGLGCGTVFAINPTTGIETMLYEFCNKKSCGDGAAPEASLIDVSGMLYGTTTGGGANTACDYGNGCGTVFSVDPTTGTETVLYSFCNQTNCTDGASPFASLIDVNGTLYGTTQSGGTHGYGTVFAITP
jgi:uncharacterized repeat protein (TIGR03803 family)